MHKYSKILNEKENKKNCRWILKKSQKLRFWFFIRKNSYLKKKLVSLDYRESISLKA